MLLVLIALLLVMIYKFVGLTATLIALNVLSFIAGGVVVSAGIRATEPQPSTNIINVTADDLDLSNKYHAPTT